MCVCVSCVTVSYLICLRLSVYVVCWLVCVFVCAFLFASFSVCVSLLARMSVSVDFSSLYVLIPIFLFQIGLLISIKFGVSSVRCLLSLTYSSGFLAPLLHSIIYSVQSSGGGRLLRQIGLFHRARDLRSRGREEGASSSPSRRCRSTLKRHEDQRQHSHLPHGRSRCK